MITELPAAVRVLFSSVQPGEPVAPPCIGLAVSSAGSGNSGREKVFRRALAVSVI